MTNWLLIYSSGQQPWLPSGVGQSRAKGNVKKTSGRGARDESLSDQAAVGGKQGQKFELKPWVQGALPRSSSQGVQGSDFLNFKQVLLYWEV